MTKEIEDLLNELSRCSLAYEIRSDKRKEVEKTLKIYADFGNRARQIMYDYYHKERK